MGQLVPLYPENDETIGHHLSEWLLLKSLEDIADRSRPDADLYTLLGVAATLRRILIDDRPLINLARARLRLPRPQFSFTPYAYSEESEPGRRTHLGFARKSFTEPSVTTNWQGFRHATCGQFDREPISVDDAIKYFANVHGGVHAGAPRSDLERTIQRFAVSVDSAAFAWADVLRRIGSVTIRALEPTRTAILANPASPIASQHK